MKNNSLRLFVFLRRYVVLVLLCLHGVAYSQASGNSSATSSSGAYPSRPIHFVVPMPAGGAYDTLVRVLGEKLSDRLGQPVVVENKPGANTTIATTSVIRAPADGHTLLLALTVLVQYPLLYPDNQTYDPFKDLVPVSKVGDAVAVLGIAPGVPADSLEQFVSLAKETEMSYGTPGVGSTTHLYGEIFSQLAGISMTHIPYRGDMSLLPDLATNRVNAGWFSPMIAEQYGGRQGKLKPLAVTGKGRTEVIPEVATFAELGFAGFDAEGWVGILAPAGTPQDIVDRLAFEIDAVLRDPEVRQRVVDIGLIPGGGTSSEFAETLQHTQEQWHDIIQRANVTLD